MRRHSKFLRGCALILGLDSAIAFLREQKYHAVPPTAGRPAAGCWRYLDIRSRRLHSVCVVSRNASAIANVTSRRSS